jgi:ribosomal protein L11 methyltransferase
MPLFKLRVAAVDHATGGAVADLIGALAVPEPLAVTLFEDGPPRFLVEAYYDVEPALEPIALALAALGPGAGAPVVEAVPDKNWVALSQAALPPVSAGRFLVHGRHDRSRLGLRRWGIEIDAGEAFGTGHGATTALCLEALDALARRCPAPARVLDLGAGSGVLAIAAARAFPAARVLAADNDAVAVAVARANARTNRGGGRVRTIEATGFAHRLLRASRPFDLVLANLLPDTLIALAPALRRRLRPGGFAVLSGILDGQVREVRAVYLGAGFHLVRRRSRVGWSAVLLQRGHEAGRRSAAAAP